MSDTPMAEAIPTVADYLRAHDVCRFLNRNLEIQFQIDGAQMDRATAEKHFKLREALVRVQVALLDEGDRLIGNTSRPSRDEEPRT